MHLLILFPLWLQTDFFLKQINLYCIYEKEEVLPTLFTIRSAEFQRSLKTLIVFQINANNSFTKCFANA